jgi:hypothetical protein
MSSKKVESWEVTLVFTPIDSMWDDVLIKIIPQLKLYICVQSLALFSPTSLVTRGDI